MTVYTEEQIENRPISPLIITGVVLAVLVLLALVLVRDGERPLKPLRPTTTPGELNQNSQPILVTFDELNANPYASLNQRIRITGSYTPQPKPDCPDYKGLLIKWALINDDLQLNARGFETILKLVPAGTNLTVEGVWRLYEGIAGCGKGATQELIWYLQVERIVQPNPLPNFGPPSDGETPNPFDTPPSDEPLPTPGGDDRGTAVPTPTLLLPTTVTATPLFIPTWTPVPSATATLLPNQPTVTVVNGRATPTPNNQTPPITATIDPTNPATTNTPPPLATPGTATPPFLTTSTPGPSPTRGPSPTPGNGYPGPSNTPPPTSYP